MTSLSEASGGTLGSASFAPEPFRFLRPSGLCRCMLRALLADQGDVPLGMLLREKTQRAGARTARGDEVPPARHDPGGHRIKELTLTVEPLARLSGFFLSRPPGRIGRGSRQMSSGQITQECVHRFAGAKREAIRAERGGERQILLWLP